MSCLENLIPRSLAPETRGIRSGAFTLIELLVVVTIIGILAALLLPTLSSAKAKAHQVACVNNLKQLAISSQLYSADNDGKLSENLTNAQANAWVLGNMKIAGQATNDVFLRSGQLFAYHRSTALYHCPADTTQTANKLNVRSYTMNGWIGSRTMSSTSPSNSAYRTFVRESELAVRPSQIWGILDEHERSLDDGFFMVTMDDSRPFINQPASRHRNSYCLNFTDGHVERFRLVDNRLLPTGEAPPANTDWIRLKQVTTVR